LFVLRCDGIWFRRAIGATEPHTGFADNRRISADPQGLGNRRILISQYGLFENEQPGDTWRADAVLSTAENAGLYGAFFWNLNDNACKRNGY